MVATVGDLKAADAKLQDLLLSCNNGAIRKVEIILRENPKLVHSYSPFLENALHIAAAAGNISICAYLMSVGANANTVNIDGWNVLHFAAKAGQTEILEHFISEGIIDIEAKNNFDQTPLFVAFDHCNSESAYTLIENGADTDTTDMHGDNPFQMLKIENPFEKKFLSELIALAMERKSTVVLKEIMRCRAVNGKLDFSHMSISDFPDEAGEVLQELPHITELDLSYNDLNTLPCTLKVQDVVIDHNELDAIPNGFRKPWSKIQGYLESVKNRATKWTECKLLFVGQEGVGKTTLLNVFKSKSGKVNCKTNLSTNGISISSGVNLAPESEKKERRKGLDFLHSKKKKDSEKKVSFNCWDLGGQEIFYPTHQFFLTCNSVYILAFDASKPEQSRIEYWMRQIRSLTNNSTKAPVFVVGTHIDDPSCTPEYLDKLQKSLARTFARSRFRGMQGVFLISSKSGDGISELKDSIYGVVTGKNFQPFVAPSWVRLHDLIQIYKTREDIVEWEQYRSWGESSGIRSNDELLLATEFLSGVGSLIHFDDKNENLNSLVILNPQWLADVMSCLITFKHSWIKDGMLPLSAIPQVFKKYSSSLYSTLLALLERFDIIHTLSPKNCTFIDEDKVVVTSMLPEESPDNFSEVWQSKVPSNFIQQGKQYIFPFLPLGFFNRLMIRLLHIPQLQGVLFWRNGIVVRYESQSAFLEFDAKTVECTVVVRSPHHLLRNRYLRDEEVKKKNRERLLLRLIADGIDTLIESYRMGTIQRLVACSHCYAKGNDPPFYFTYIECVDAITQGATTLYCEHTQQKSNAVSIENLAPDIAFADIPLINSADLTIGEELGRGAFGIVYRGDWLGSQVAVKQLASAYINDDAFSEFQQEVFIMSQLHSPFLVALRGVTLIPKLMMIIEYLPCGDLFQLLHPPKSKVPNARISKKDFPWSLRLMFALDIARGLHYLQTNSPPIAHRDLRSPNIFLCSLDETAPVRAKVADFGLARTVANQVYGALDTWQWIAPEAIFDSTFDLRSDIYSLGVCLWEIASRNYPFDEYVYHPNYSIDNPNGDRILDQIKVKRAIVNENLRPSLPPEKEGCPKLLEGLIQQCWDTDPNKRPTIVEIVACLSKLTETDVEKPPEEEYLPITPRAGADETIVVNTKPQIKISLDLDELRADAPDPDDADWLTSESVQQKLQEAGISPHSPRTESEAKNSSDKLSADNKSHKRKSLSPGRRGRGLTEPSNSLRNSSSPNTRKKKKPKGNSRKTSRPNNKDISHSSPSVDSTELIDKPESERSKLKRNESTPVISRIPKPAKDTKKSLEENDKPNLVVKPAEENSTTIVEFRPFKNTARTIYPDISAIDTHSDFAQMWVSSVSGKISVYDNNLELKTDWPAHECRITAMLCVKPRILRHTTIWSGDMSGYLRVWDADEYSMKQEWKPFSRPCAIDLFCLFTGRGSKVWVASKTENELSVFDTDSVQLLHILRLDNKQKPTVLSQARDTVWVGTNNGNISIYSANSLLLLSWAAHPGAITGICPTTTETVWTCCAEGNLSMWNFKERKIEALRTIELHHPLYSMISVPHFNAVWCISESGSITIWEADTCSLAQEIASADIIEFGTPKFPLCAVGHNDFVVVLSGMTMTKWVPK